MVSKPNFLFEYRIKHEAFSMIFKWADKSVEEMGFYKILRFM